MPQPICNLATKNCKPCTEGLAALDQNEIDRLLQTLNGWEQRGHELVKTYPFKNYYETMAFRTQRPGFRTTRTTTRISKSAIGNAAFAIQHTQSVAFLKMISFVPRSWTPCKPPPALEFNNANPGR